MSTSCAVYLAVIPGIVDDDEFTLDLDTWARNNDTVSVVSTIRFIDSAGYIYLSAQDGTVYTPQYRPVSIHARGQRRCQMNAVLYKGTDCILIHADSLAPILRAGLRSIKTTCSDSEFKSQCIAFANKYINIRDALLLVSGMDILRNALDETVSILHAMSALDNKMLRMYEPDDEVLLCLSMLVLSSWCDIHQWENRGAFVEHGANKLLGYLDELEIVDILDHRGVALNLEHYTLPIKSADVIKFPTSSSHCA